MHTPARRWLAVLGAVMHVIGAASYTLNMSPERVRINKDVTTNVTIQCTADVPLTACQLSWWSEDSPGPVLGRAPGGGAAPGVPGLSYARAGECGFSLTLLGKKVWTVGCRGQAAAGGWKYATMDLLAYSTEPLPGVVVERTSVVVLPGKGVNVMCSSPEPVDACYFSLPGKPGYLDFYRGLSSHDSAGRHIYRGSGRQSGECGLTWRDIGEEDNGPVRCYLWKSPRFAENRGINVIVARAPDKPVLQVAYEGAKLRATCTVKGGRPAPDLQWLLGDDVIRNDAVDDAVGSIHDAWTWPWSVTSVTQTLTRTLEPGDYGKVLKCVTSHVVLDEPLEARQTVTKSGDERPSSSGPGVSTPATHKSRRCSAAAVLETFCADRASACPGDEHVRQLRLKQAETALRAAELAEEAGRVLLEAAKSSARAEDARARSEEARAREEEAWAKNAAEELEYEQERRKLDRKQLRKA